MLATQNKKRFINHVLKADLDHMCDNNTNFLFGKLYLTSCTAASASKLGNILAVPITTFTCNIRHFCLLVIGESCESIVAFRCAGKSYFLELSCLLTSRRFLFSDFLIPMKIRLNVGKRIFLTSRKNHVELRPGYFVING